MGFTERHRQRKPAREQDQSHSQNVASDALEDINLTAPSALTPPSTLCTSRRESLISCFEENRPDNVIDWDFFLDPNDRYGVEKGTEELWTSSPKDTATFADTALVPFSELENHARRNLSDSIDHNESNRMQRGPTVLHRAVQTGNSKVVRLLLEHNADCNSKDNVGLTPLMCAIIGGHEEALELLLSHGAGIGVVDNVHRSALHWAVLHNRHNILKRLLDCCSGDTLLLNRQNKDGETPLSIAVGAGSEVAVKLLLEFGATVNGV